MQLTYQEEIYDILSYRYAILSHQRHLFHFSTKAFTRPVYSFLWSR